VSTIEKARTATDSAPLEVVTNALTRLLRVPSAGAKGGFVTVALITLDNGRDHTRPSTLGPLGLASLDAAISTAVEAAPDAIAINDTLGWIQYKKGNYVIAVGLLTEVVNKLPQSAEYRYHLGMALNAAGQKDRAKEELKKALQLTPPLNHDDTGQAQTTLAKL